MSRLLPHQVWVETDRPDFPNRCVNCGKDAETVYRPTPPLRPKGLPLPERPLELPYCQLCLKNLNESHLLATRRLVALNIGLWGTALVMGLKLNSMFVAIPLIGAILILVWANRVAKLNIQEGTNLQGIGVAVKSLWHKKSTYVFSFSNESVAADFKSTNSSQLTPQSEIQNY